MRCARTRFAGQASGFLLHSFRAASIHFPECWQISPRLLRQRFDNPSTALRQPFDGSSTGFDKSMESCRTTQGEKSKRGGRIPGAGCTRVPFSSGPVWEPGGRAVEVSKAGTPCLQTVLSFIRAITLCLCAIPHLLSSSIAGCSESL